MTLGVSYGDEVVLAAEGEVQTLRWTPCPRCWNGISTRLPADPGAAKRSHHLVIPALDEGRGDVGGGG